MAQVSRLDPWKDPIGVVRAFYLAKNEVPDLQLILAGLVIAQDDPEALAVLKTVVKHAKGDPDIYLFSDVARLKDVSVESFVSAVYTGSDVVVQKSLREGFGLTITEAMWKGKAVVAGRTAGTAVQIRNGRNGFLVSSPEGTARAVVRLLRDARLRVRLGRAGRASVKERFLMARLIVDHLAAYATLAKRPVERNKAARRPRRDLG
jgi:trehalose synthase